MENNQWDNFILGTAKDINSFFNLQVFFEIVIELDIFAIFPTLRLMLENFW